MQSSPPGRKKTETNSETTSCAEDDAVFIEERADKVFNAVAPPDPDAAEEVTHYKITDDKGSIIAGCTSETDEQKTADLFRL